MRQGDTVIFPIFSFVSEHFLSKLRLYSNMGSLKSSWQDQPLVQHLMSFVTPGSSPDLNSSLENNHRAVESVSNETEIATILIEFQGWPQQSEIRN